MLAQPGAGGLSAFGRDNDEIGIIVPGDVHTLHSYFLLIICLMRGKPKVAIAPVDKPGKA
jgi:hypothetical protein